MAMTTGTATGTTEGRDWLAVVVGGLRCASGVSFLVAPDAANRAWGDESDVGATGSLLLRSMGYRDALIGGLLFASGVRGTRTAGWFLASAGADTADLLGGIANHDRMTDVADRQGHRWCGGGCRHRCRRSAARRSSSATGLRADEPAQPIGGLVDNHAATRSRQSTIR